MSSSLPSIFAWNILEFNSFIELSPKNILDKIEQYSDDQFLQCFAKIQMLTKNSCLNFKLFIN